MKVIISGGGTGGHIFPAIAIADELKRRIENIDLLFVGAEGRMEMERIPKAGYPIEGLWISGLQRRLTWKNILFPIKLVHSLVRARKILKRFRPKVVIGVGGYASGPTLFQAASLGIPTLIQEQNSYPGITNKWLARRVDRICTAYDQMDRWFPANKIQQTGNPIRKELKASSDQRAEALQHFGLNPDRKTMLVVGGSLGARTLNESVEAHGEAIVADPNVQVLWQVGKSYYQEFSMQKTHTLDQVHMVPFIDRMDLAYAAADLVIARAGALTVSELCLMAKPSVLVPSPYVAEDHQTKNAQSLVDKKAALLVPDDRARTELIPIALDLIHNEQQCNDLRNNIFQLAKPNATEKIVDEIIKLIEAKNDQ